MSKGRIRVKQGSRPQSKAGGPSAFFLIALAVGLLLLGWMAWEWMKSPAVEAPPATSTAAPAR